MIENNNEQILTCEGVVASLVAEITALKSRTAEKSKIDSDLETAKEWKTKLTSKVDDWSSHTEFFTKNEVCPSCSQGIPHDHKATIVSELQVKIEVETKRLDDLNNVLTRLNGELTTINNLVNQITDKNIELSTQNSTITVLNRQNSELQAEIEAHKTDTTNVD